jgi:hypothetical protein
VKTPKIIYLFEQNRRGVLHIWHSDKVKRGKSFLRKGPFTLSWSFRGITQDCRSEKVASFAKPNGDNKRYQRPGEVLGIDL